MCRTESSYCEVTKCSQATFKLNVSVLLLILRHRHEMRINKY